MTDQQRTPPQRPSIPETSESSARGLTRRFDGAHERFEVEYREGPNTTYGDELTYAALAGSLQHIAADAIARVRALEDELRHTKRNLADLEQAVMDHYDSEAIFEAQATERSRVELVG